MLKNFTILFVLLVFVQNIYAQDTITLSAKDYEDVSEIYPGKKYGWYFKQGVDSTWQEFGKGWRKLRPVDINASMTDSKRIFEGWFRAFIHFDSSFSKQQLSIFLGTRAAQDIFIDGVLYVSSGNTGLNGRVYKENEGIYNYSQAIELPNIKAGSTHLFLWHIKDTVAAPFSSQYLKSELLGGIHNLFEIVSPEFVAWQKSRAPYITGISILGNGIVFILFILFLLLWLLNRSDKNLLRFTIFCGVYFFSLGVSNFEHSIFYPTNISYLEEKLFDFIGNTLVVFFISYAPYLLSKLENHRLASLTKWTVPISLVASTVGFFKTIDSNNNLFFLLIVILNLLLSLYFVIELYRTGKKLNRIIVTGVVGSLFFMSFLPLMTPVYGYKLFFLFLFLSSVSFPISLMIYTAVRFKLILSEVRVNAETIVALSEEKRIYAEQQQHLLEEEVNRQTIELKKSLSDLQSAQSQLIQSEKMASLGELTAGIAHEIHNPLGSMRLAVDGLLQLGIEGAARHGGLLGQAGHGPGLARPDRWPPGFRRNLVRHLDTKGRRAAHSRTGRLRCPDWASESPTAARTLCLDPSCSGA